MGTDFPNARPSVSTSSSNTFTHNGSQGRSAVAKKRRGVVARQRVGLSGQQCMPPASAPATSPRSREHGSRQQSTRPDTPGHLAVEISSGGGLLRRRRRLAPSCSGAARPGVLCDRAGRCAFGRGQQPLLFVEPQSLGGRACRLGEFSITSRPPSCRGSSLDLPLLEGSVSLHQERFPTVLGGIGMQTRYDLAIIRIRRRCVRGGRSCDLSGQVGGDGRAWHVRRHVREHRLRAVEGTDRSRGDPARGRGPRRPGSRASPASRARWTCRP